MLLPSAREAGLVGGRGTPLRAPPPFLSKGGGDGAEARAGLCGRRDLGLGTLGAAGNHFGRWDALGLVWWGTWGLRGLDRRIKLRKCALGVGVAGRERKSAWGYGVGRGSASGLREG